MGARRIERVVTLAALGGILASSAVGAQPVVPSGGIIGQITSLVTQQPVAGAVVAVEGTERRTETDADGRFSIAGLTPGSYRLSIAARGFIAKREADVAVTADRSTPLSLTLQDAVAHAEEVNVSASYFAKPEDLATSAFHMSYEDVRRAPGAMGDVSRMLQTLPSAMARDDTRNEIVARGGSPSENLILVDGIEVPNLSHFGDQGVSGGAISMLNSELISGVDFMAGGFPAPYGQRLSSVLEVTLREGNRERFESEFDLGIAGAGFVAEGPIGKRGSWIASARRSYLDAVAPAFSLSDVPLYANYQAKATYDLSQRNRLSLVSLGGWEKMHEDAVMTDTSEPDVMVENHVGWRTVTGLNLRTLFGGRGVGTLSLAYAENAFDNDGWDKMLNRELVEHNRSRERETTAKYDLTYDLRGVGTLRAGLHGKRVTPRLDLSQPLGAQNPFSTDPTRINALVLDTRFSTWQGAGYLQLARHLAGRATLTLGGRYDYFALRKATRLSPRAGLSLRVARGLDLTASAGLYYQLPALVLMKATPVNAELGPIRADHYVAGLAYYPRPDMKITIEAYYKRYDGYPVSTQIPSLSLAGGSDAYDAQVLLMPMSGVGRGRSSGVELYAQKKLTHALWGQVSYAYSRTEQRALDGVWRPGGFDLPHVVSIVAGYRINRGIEVSSKFSYASGAPGTPLLLDLSAAQNREVYDVTRINAERLPAYSRLDLRADKRFAFKWGGLVLYVEADNVYNRKNVRDYVWNPKTVTPQIREQLRFMAVGGITVRF
jgi:hypothetical protein